MRSTTTTAPASFSSPQLNLAIIHDLDRIVYNPNLKKKLNDLKLMR